MYLMYEVRFSIPDDANVSAFEAALEAKCLHHHLNTGKKRGEHIYYAFMTQVQVVAGIRDLLALVRQCKIMRVFQTNRNFRPTWLHVTWGNVGEVISEVQHAIPSEGFLEWFVSANEIDCSPKDVNKPGGEIAYIDGVEKASGHKSRLGLAVVDGKLQLEFRFDGSRGSTDVRIMCFSEHETFEQDVWSIERFPSLPMGCKQHGEAIPGNGMCYKCHSKVWFEFPGKRSPRYVEVSALALQMALTILSRPSGLVETPIIYVVNQEVGARGWYLQRDNPDLPKWLGAYDDFVGPPIGYCKTSSRLWVTDCELKDRAVVYDKPAILIRFARRNWPDCQIRIVGPKDVVEHSGVNYVFMPESREFDQDGWVQAIVRPPAHLYI